MYDPRQLTLHVCCCETVARTVRLTEGQKYPRGQMYLAALFLYILQLLESGTCSNSSTMRTRDNESAMVGHVAPVTSETSHQSGDGPDTYGTNTDIFGYLNTNVTNKKYVNSNDVLTKLGLDTPIQHDVNTSTPTTVISNVSTTQTTDAYTRRDIYIRGHLLRHPASARKSYHSPVNSGLSRGPPQAGVPLARVQGSLDSSESGGRQKRKHSSREETNFFNYKRLYDTPEDGEQSSRKGTGFYAWIFGAAMLSFGSVTMATSCFVFWFCGHRARQQRAAHARRPSDKAGEYQRVESVSSIVDHGGDPPETIYEEPTDSVTII